MKILMLAALAAMSACSMMNGRPLLGGAAPVAMEADPKNPAAEGSVVFSKAANDNTGISLTVKHMANPERLTPPAHSYVVWLRTAKDAPAQNIGSLVVDSNLTGTLTTVTAQHNFELFITAEDTGQAQKPSGQAILWARHRPSD